MKPHYKLIAIFILIGIIFACIFVKCEAETVVNDFDPTENEILKSVIQDLNNDRDSLRKITGKKDSVRTIYVTKWKQLKGRIDSIPCDSAIVLVVNMCDTIIMQDSSQITTLKDVIKLDSNIIANYEKVVHSDSLYIEQLKKDVETTETQRATLVWQLFLGVAILK
jgi:hypothetical protein